ncbi:bestrophin family protein [Comamonas composti]|uniref:bestrophin family protein n=1 Tax=Comamonas composti TaxID=408558 RepID=UPI0003F7D0B2|nr:bestrophin family ion channel [Comamonas composti]
MIVRPPMHWLRMLFVWRGSVLPKIAPQLIATTLFALAVTFVHGRVLDWKVSLNFVPFSLIGLTLAIFLGFRNGTSYARYWEARTLWGSVLIESRSLTRQALTLCRNPAQAQILALRLCAFAHALKHQLRGSDGAADMARFLPPADCQRLALARFKPAMALLLAGEWLGDRMQAGEVPPPVVPALEASLSHLSGALGGCERIASTPIPFTYAVIIHRCIYLYCFWLPFGLLDAIGWMTPVIVCFIAYTFFALEALGAEIENPFGNEPNDLPLGAISHGIESSVLDMLGEPPRTEAPVVERGFILD